MKAPKCVADYKELRQLATHEACDHIFVAGLPDPENSGLQGFFEWRPHSLAADNGGTVIRPNGVQAVDKGRWHRVFDGAISVKWFGAKGDGTSDDGAAIQNAIDAALTGGAVHIPAGTYVITSQLAYTTHVSTPNTQVAGLVIVGDGPDKTILDNRVPLNAMLYAGEGDTDLVFQRGLRLENFGIITSTVPPGSSGIQISHQYNGTIKNCSIRGLSGDAIQILGTMPESGNPDARASAWISLENNQLRNCARGVNVITTGSQYGVGFLLLRHNYVAQSRIGGVRLKGLVVKIEGHGGSENGPLSWPQQPALVDGVAEGAIYFHRGQVTNANQDIIIEGGELDGSRPSQIWIDTANNVSIRNVEFHRSASIAANNVNGLVMLAVINGVVSNNSFRIDTDSPQYTAYSIDGLTQFVKIEKTGFYAFSGAHTKYSDGGFMDTIEENGVLTLPSPLQLGRILPGDVRDSVENCDPTSMNLRRFCL
jgi:hypothetical protein